MKGLDQQNMPTLRIPTVATAGAFALLVLLAGASPAAAKPRIIGEVIPSCALTRKAPVFKDSVCIQLENTTYSSYANGAELAYYFTNNDTGQTITFPAVPNQQRPCFRVPAGSYTVFIKTKPVDGLGQSSSEGYQVTIPVCRLTPSKRPNQPDRIFEK